MVELFFYPNSHPSSLTHSFEFDCRGAQRGSHDGAKNSVLRLLDGMASVKGTAGSCLSYSEADYCKL